MYPSVTLLYTNNSQFVTISARKSEEICLHFYNFQTVGSKANEQCLEGNAVPVLSWRDRSKTR